MSFIVSAPEGNSIPLIEAGTYAAICVGIIDVGEQYSEAYDKYSRKAIFQWEIPDETIEIDGETVPRMISETYTASLAERSNLRGVLESWRGKQFTEDELRGFDLANVLGAPCLLNIIHAESSKGKKFASVASISRLPKGMHVDTSTEKVMFCLDDAGALERVDKFPEWIQKRIKESLTYKNLVGAYGTPVAADDNLPF